MTFVQMLNDVLAPGKCGSLTAAAASIGFSPQYLHDLKEGRRLPSVVVVNKICDWMGRGPEGRLAWHRAGATAHGWEVNRSQKSASSAEKPERSWQPIETAPWSGPPVLLWKEDTKEHYVAARVRGEHGPGWCTPDGYQIFNATHWMPLPIPPSPIQGGG